MFPQISRFRYNVVSSSEKGINEAEVMLMVALYDYNPVEHSPNDDIEVGVVLLVVGGGVVGGRCGVGGGMWGGWGGKGWGGWWGVGWLVGSGVVSGGKE